MATGPEHYEEAERLIAEYRAYRAAHKGTIFVTTPLWLSEAQVHATLALAAARAPERPPSAGRITSESAMNQIQNILRGPEWGPDTLNEIRDVVQLTGRSTQDPDEEDS